MEQVLTYLRSCFRNMFMFGTIQTRRFYPWFPMVITVYSMNCSYQNKFCFF